MEKRLQLFLLPFAGGNSTSLKKLISLLNAEIEAIPVEYAGRVTRHNEKFIENYDEFLTDVALYIKERRNSELPYAVFGYSLGSVLTYDLLSQGLIDGVPSHAFVCAKGSLFHKSASQYYQKLPDKEFIKEIIALGGTDKRILQNERFLNIYMQPVRADYIIWGQYSYKPGRIPCNATAIYSDKDPAAKGVHDWSKIVDGVIEYYEMGTNHFFINQYWHSVADIVNNHLKKYLA